jgi:hypothetical protein
MCSELMKLLNNPNLTDALNQRLTRCFFGVSVSSMPSFKIEESSDLLVGIYHMLLLMKI